MAAAEAAGFGNLPLYHPEQLSGGGGAPHVQQSYYIAKHHIDANHVVDISAQMDKKIEALCCHRTQMEFTLAGLKRDIAALGGPPEVRATIDPAEYGEAIDRAMRNHDSGIGAKIGAAYGEEFRLSRDDSLSRFLEERGDGKQGSG
jgi:LmbE family N-acetylglucosaminyl deacetylase